jgi:dTDP-glucose pyrophosphorylase
MKAILLAGGKGTRLRPLTIHTPKPIVPIFDRAFLHYQIDLLKQVPEIDEVILSLNYQPSASVMLSNRHRSAQVVRFDSLRRASPTRWSCSTAT